MLVQAVTFQTLQKEYTVNDKILWGDQLHQFGAKVKLFGDQQVSKYQTFMLK
jgi:hypothetical protein